MLVFQLRSQLREENKIKTVMSFQLYLSKVTHSSHPYKCAFLDVRFRKLAIVESPLVQRFTSIY